MGRLIWVNRYVITRLICLVKLPHNLRTHQQALTQNHLLPSRTMSTYHPIPPINLDTFVPPVGSLCFDPVTDTLWAGSESGVLSAHHTPRGLRGVAFPIGSHSSVSKIVAGENYVRAYGARSTGIGSWAKGGVNKWFYKYVCS